MMNRVYPMTARLSTIDKSSIVLTYKHDTLMSGVCYLLKFDTDMLGMEINPAIENKLCTSRCLCNPKGQKSCNEDLGICECHYPYTGTDCTSCLANFIFDSTTNECHPSSKCKDNGGEEDCNGHGTCYEDSVSGQAKCDCEEGFTDDGNDYCGKCVDPLFTYPNCAIRTWVIEQSNPNC